MQRRCGENEHGQGQGGRVHGLQDLLVGSSPPFAGGGRPKSEFYLKNKYKQAECFVFTKPVVIFANKVKS